LLGPVTGYRRGHLADGRGIPLMRALADNLTIDTSALGTTVCLRFDNVHAPQGADAKVG
jgi:serine/threonine-protein kinase RsbW